MTLGQLLGAVLEGNPKVVIMATVKLNPGVPVEPTGIKIATIEGKPVIVLTI